LIILLVIAIQTRYMIT